MRAERRGHSDLSEVLLGGGGPLPLGLTWTENGASQAALVVKNPPATVGDIKDMGLIPGLRRFPGRGHGNLLQYSYLENLMERGAWQATVPGVAKNQTRLRQLGMHPSMD